MDSTEHHEPRHPMGVVTQRTGLSSDAIRAWERRYGAVAPGRSPAGHRLYSDADVERLRLLRRLTLGGRQIGRIASRPDRELLELLREDESAGATAPRRPVDDAVAAELLDEAISSVEALDAEGLDRVLRRAALSLSAPAFLDSLLAPLMSQIGDEWEAGAITPAHEHLASAVSARITGWLLEGLHAPEGAPTILISTPSGQAHELGALAAAVAAAAEGWRVRYLGASLPAEDLARAARDTRAAAVALSVVYPAGDPETAAEIESLGASLPKTVPLIVGGRAAGSYDETLERTGAIRLDAFDDLAVYLRRLAAA